VKNKASKTFSIKSRIAVKSPAVLVAFIAKLLFVFIIFQTVGFAQGIFDLPAPGTSAERTLGNDERHIYQIGLEQNEFAQVRVEQFGSNVYLSAFDPDGKLILTSESRNSALGLEVVSVVAANAGVYRFEVGTIRAPELGEGKYRINLAILRQASADDADLLKIERVFMQAMRLAEGGSFASRRESLEKYARAAAGFQKQGDLARAAIAFNQLGHTQNLLGEKRAALENFQKARNLFREAGDAHGETVALRFLGNWYNTAGEGGKAIEILNEALEITRKNRLAGDESGVLQTLAAVYASLGKTDEATNLYEQVLKMRVEKPEIGLFSNYILLNRIGDLYAQRENWRKALDFYFQAAEANKKRGGATTDGLPINSFWRVGRAYIRLGDAKKALEILNDGKKREEKIRDPQRLGNILLSLGEAHFALGEKQKALEFFRLSATTFQSIFNSNGEAFAHFSAARAERDLGNLEAARVEIEVALEIVESLRARLDNQDFRISYFATTEDYYDFYIELLGRLHAKNPQAGFDRLAWAASERARARTLAEMLREAGVNIRQGVAAELLEQERKLQIALNEKAELQMQLALARNQTDAADEAAKVNREIENLSVELSLIQTKIRQTSPRYAALTLPNAPNLTQAQNALDAETVILEYKLGTERSFLWLVGRTSLEQIDLPPRAEIETLARQFYEQISSRKSEAQAEAVKISESLSRILLGAAREKIKNKRLLIVADGALQLVPFASLKAQSSRFEVRSSTVENRFLIETNEIINLPSASILPLLRENLPARTPNGKTLALFADAVFTDKDVRLPSKKISSTGQIEIKLNAFDSRLKLSRLPFSRREANAIMAIAPPKETFAALDFAASRETLLKTNLKQFRIIHFATHGWLDAEHPQLSGIVLSLVSTRGERLNGFLRLHEIYNLDLAADLVVLSACQTGLGKTVRNEGVIGLTRGFMYAGASRVMASLWNVDDAATAELMSRFYQNLLREKRSPAASLRAAQISLAREKRWQNPYFWAAFSIQGEWQ
jgi:CHAT domain-containing protein